MITVDLCAFIVTVADTVCLLGVMSSNGSSVERISCHKTDSFRVRTMQYIHTAFKTFRTQRPSCTCSIVIDLLSSSVNQSTNCSTV